MADRLDTLAGCFAIGLSPTGTADPYGLRRACLGVLRTMIERGFDLRLSDAFRAAYDGFAVKLDLSRDELAQKLGDFFAERLKGLLADKLPMDAVQACLAVAANRPLDARARALAVVQLDAATRARVGEVFKRATNIASDAPPGAPETPAAGAHESEVAVHERFMGMKDRLATLTKEGKYGEAFAEVAGFAPLLHQYFLDVFVMAEDPAIRDNRLRLMRAISETCAALARFDLLGEEKG
jgi:glycyl-tRNA synthetase beta chain